MTNAPRQLTVSRILPDLPLVIWMILITLFIGLLAGMNASPLIHEFNLGYGASIGDFALILIPSFILAAAIEQQRTAMPSVLSAAIAPFAAAGMVCPDTAYAALSPMCRQRKLPMAFGAFAGFKLLFPAGPLIVATSLRADVQSVLLICVLIFLPVWAVGVLYGRFAEDRFLAPAQPAISRFAAHGSLTVLIPFAVLAILLIIGIAFDTRFSSWLNFITSAKGALLAAAVTALAMIPPASRRPAVDQGLRRAAGLLLIIGAASAFSLMLTHVFPVGEIFAVRSGAFAIVAIFLLTATFKVLQGSSMSTFAAVGPVAAPIVAASGVSPALAVLAVCLGSFIAILPNDSFYWLVRHDALSTESETTSIAVLAGGAILQALTGLALLLLLSHYWT